MRIKTALLVVGILASGIYGQSAAFAQGKKAQGREPLEITANESLEWHRNEKVFIARKNVKAVQGATTLKSAILKAHYREGEDGGSGMKIYSVVAEGGVEILSQDSKAYGDRATYDLDKGYAVLTGKNPRLISPEQTVTAQDKIEYWSVQGKMQASGRAKAVREGDEIVADVLIAEFKDDGSGKRVLETLRANGNVVITTPQEILTGDEGIYSADTNLAELTGNVKITRGQNILEGERAQVDLDTNISMMFGDAKAGADGTEAGTGGGRVRAVFYPGSEDQPEISPIP